MHLEQKKLKDQISPFSCVRERQQTGEESAKLKTMTRSLIFNSCSNFYIVVIQPTSLKMSSEETKKVVV